MLMNKGILSRSAMQQKLDKRVNNSCEQICDFTSNYKYSIIINILKCMGTFENVMR